MNTVSTGRQAEQLVADWLEQQGGEVLARNVVVMLEQTKTECDIVVYFQTDRTLAIVEVKYRASTIDGGGVAGVTATKLRRLRRAAGAWLQQHRNTVPGPLETIRIDVADVGPAGLRDYLTNVW